MAHARSAHEVIVHDDLQDCPYLPDRQACMPLRLQLSQLGAGAFDESLAAGDRRVGRMLYRTACPGCAACQALRIPVRRFVPSRSQRRAARRNRDVRIQVGSVGMSDDHLALFNRHRLERSLSTSGRAMKAEEYLGWFVQTCTRTVEMRYLVGERLVGVGIVDLGTRDSSSVYFYFDPDEGRRSLGTYSVLVECAWLRARGGRHHYLGLWADGSPHLEYKARFLPHQRLVAGRWLWSSRSRPT